MPTSSRFPFPFVFLGALCLISASCRQAQTPSPAAQKAKRAIANRDYDLAISITSDALSEDVRGRNYAELMMLRAEAKYLGGNFSEGSLKDAWQDSAAAIGATPNDAEAHYQFAFIAHSLADRVAAGQVLLDLKWLRAEEEQHLAEAVRLNSTMRSRAHGLMPQKF